MRALLVVDIQNDFLPGGSLPVPEGDEVISITNRVMTKIDLIVASKDWHPNNHGSFAQSHPNKKVGDMIKLDGLDQILWPVHCVQKTPGADFSPALNQDAIDYIVHKGQDKNVDSYSAFFDNNQRNSTGLDAYLKSRGVKTLYIVGLATDYCVKYSVLDALSLGFQVLVVTDACRGVNVKKGDDKAALEEMKAAGAKLISSEGV